MALTGLMASGVLLCGAGGPWKAGAHSRMAAISHPHLSDDASLLQSILSNSLEVLSTFENQCD